MTPLRGNTFLFCSYRQLHCVHSRLLTRDSPYALLSELKKNKDTVRFAALVEEVPGHS